MTGFLADAAVTLELENVLQQPSGLSATFWGPLVTSSNVSAYAFLRRTLAARGYSPAQIAEWDDGAEFQLSIATWWCLVKGCEKDRIDSKMLGAFDRRDEVRSVPITVAGVLINPPTGIQVTTTPFDTGGDMFPGYFDPSDPRIGDPVGPEF